jgi:hypothetical protein
LQQVVEQAEEEGRQTEQEVGVEEVAGVPAQVQVLVWVQV